MIKLLRLSFELVKIIVISLAIIIPVRYFLIQPFYVKGASMEPNFSDSEYLIVDEISYRLGEPKRGDIIVFRYPPNPEEHFIKRIIGLPGEKVQVKDGAVYVYNSDYSEGVSLSEPYLAPGTRTNSLHENIITLDDDEYFVLGDNRNSSKDSRTFGPVERKYITGTVWIRGWPFDRFNIFGDQEYQF